VFETGARNCAENNINTLMKTAGKARKSAPEPINYRMEISSC
jgi:hypothetical protein